MTDEKPRVIIIPPKPELQQTAAVTKQLRVAAYCRVSTKEEEQASSYEAQCEYYTDKIMSNKEWTMAGIFADEGITGTSTKKRTEFLRMIRQCKQKKIDLILTKSIQRFARNTLDCINYTRILRQLGIGVLFEKENINSLPPDSEFMITMYGAMAQSESESISGNIRRGKQMHAKVGTLKIPCYRLFSSAFTKLFLEGRIGDAASYQNRQKSCANSTSDMRAAPACEICKTGWKKIRSKRFSENQNGQQHPSRAS